MANADLEYLWPIDQGVVLLPHYSSAQLNHVFKKLWQKGVKITVSDRLPTFSSLALEMIETHYGAHLRRLP